MNDHAWWNVAALAFGASMLAGGFLVARWILRRVRASGQTDVDPAPYVLDARLARGEISPAEYAEMRRVLGSPETTRPPSWLSLGVGLVVFAAGAAGLGIAASHRSETPAQPGEPVRAGRLIFDTGTAPSGQPIPYSGGMMMRASCADCHGADGLGRRTMMFVSPNITYPNLTDPAGMLQPDGTRGPTYTDASLEAAITQGVDPEGDALSSPMPRWHLTESEWRDLLAYLKTLR